MDIHADCLIISGDSFTFPLCSANDYLQNCKVMPQAYFLSLSLSHHLPPCGQTEEISESFPLRLFWMKTKNVKSSLFVAKVTLNVAHDIRSRTHFFTSYTSRVP